MSRSLKSVLKVTLIAASIITAIYLVVVFVLSFFFKDSLNAIESLDDDYEDADSYC